MRRRRRNFTLAKTPHPGRWRGEFAHAPLDSRVVSSGMYRRFDEIPQNIVLAEKLGGGRKVSSAAFVIRHRGHDNTRAGVAKVGGQRNHTCGDWSLHVQCFGAKFPVRLVALR